ncbi:putative ankyrin repeat protein [Tanacetum coccineum]
MDRLISLEPSSVVAIRMEQGQKCYGQVTLRNVMYTMPVAFRLQPMNKARYTIRPQSGIISPLTTLSVVVPGAAVKNPSSTHDSVPIDWFTTRKKQVFVDSGQFEKSATYWKASTRLTLKDRRYSFCDFKKADRPSSSTTWSSRPDLRLGIRELIECTTKDGNAALQLAEEERETDSLGDDNMVKLLLLKGANKDIRNRSGKTAYEVAVEHGHTRLFDSLRLGDRLCTASRKGEVRTINRVLESGAAINGIDQHGWTALHRASFKGYTDVVRVLIEKGVNIDARDEEGSLQLHWRLSPGNA